MKDRDKAATAALRTLIAAIDNAGAVPPGPAWPPVVGRPADVPRRHLTEADIEAILRKEAAELQVALSEYERLGLEPHAAELRAKLTVIQRYLPPNG